MSDLLVLDTHALLWFLQADPRLGANAERALRTSRVGVAVPALVLAEACFLIEAHRTAVASSEELFTTLQKVPSLRIVPLTAAIVRLGAKLTLVRELHDRQIVATTLSLIQRGKKARLVTKDANITSSDLVPILW